MAKFWNWLQNEQRELTINGTIADESWWDDDVTPEMFRSELNQGNGDIVVWINSPGGDCFAASQIYTMLTEYPGKVTIKIDGIAASAASVIAMAGDEVLMSPTALMMIHNPATMAFGNTDEMQKAIEMLNEVKESIINAYEKKTGLQRSHISRLMDAETWMNARKAIELKFADGTIGETETADAYVFEARTTENRLMSMAVAKAKANEPKGRRYDDMIAELERRKK